MVPIFLVPTQSVSQLPGRRTVSPQRGMKRQSAGLLNHISTRPIKQWRTKLGPESRHGVHSWAIESLCLHPHLLHHFQSGVHPSYHKLIFALQTRSVQKLPPAVTVAFLWLGGCFSAEDAAAVVSVCSLRPLQCCCNARRHRDISVHVQVGINRRHVTD